MGIVPRFADEWVLLRILKSTGRAPIRLMMKDGVNISPPGVSPVATVVLQDRQTLAGLLHDPEVGFGDAYMDGRIEVEGDLVALLEAIYQAMEHAPFTGSWYQRAASRWMDKLQDNSRSGSRSSSPRAGAATPRRCPTR